MLAFYPVLSAADVKLLACDLSLVTYQNHSDRLTDHFKERQSRAAFADAVSVAEVCGM